MTLNEATVRGIARLRQPRWGFKNAYVRLDLIKHGDSWLHGPWLHYYSPDEQKVIGVETPQTVLCIGDTTSDYEEYTGPLAPQDEASAAVDSQTSPK